MNWEAKIIAHRGSKRIAVYFEKNAELILRIKQIEGSRWSQTLGVWHIPDTEENRIRFKIAPLTYSLPSVEGIAQIEKPACRQAGSNNSCVPSVIAKVHLLLIPKL